MRRQQRRPSRVVQRRRVVEQHQVCVLGERVRRRRSLRGEHVQGGVPFGGEIVPDLPAPRCRAASRLPDRGRMPPARRAGSRRPRRRPEGPRVPEHDIGVRYCPPRQREPGTERQVVDDHLVGLHRVDDVQDARRRSDRIPQQVGPPRLGLVAQRRHHAVPGGGEETAERGVLAGCLLLGPDDPGIGAPAEHQIGAVEAELGDDAGGRRAAGHHHPLAGVPPGGGQGGQRQQVRGVVRADHQQRHAPPPCHERPAVRATPA